MGMVCFALLYPICSKWHPSCLCYLLLLDSFPFKYSFHPSTHSCLLLATYPGQRTLDKRVHAGQVSSLSQGDIIDIIVRVVFLPANNKGSLSLFWCLSSEPHKCSLSINLFPGYLKSGTNAQVCKACILSNGDQTTIQVVQRRLCSSLWENVPQILRAHSLFWSHTDCKIMLM